MQDIPLCPEWYPLWHFPDVPFSWWSLHYMDFNIQKLVFEANNEGCPGYSSVQSRSHSQQISWADPACECFWKALNAQSPCWGLTNKWIWHYGNNALFFLILAWYFRMMECWDQSSAFAGRVLHGSCTASCGHPRGSCCWLFVEQPFPPVLFHATEGKTLQNCITLERLVSQRFSLTQSKKQRQM